MGIFRVWRAAGGRRGTYTNLLQLPRRLEHHHLVRRVREFRRQRGGQAREPAADDEHLDPLPHFSGVELWLTVCLY